MRTRCRAAYGDGPTKYRVDYVLGVGGMGVVVAAHHTDLDDKVAIKFLLPTPRAPGKTEPLFDDRK